MSWFFCLGCGVPCTSQYLGWNLGYRQNNMYEKVVSEFSQNWLIVFSFFGGGGPLDIITGFIPFLIFHVFNLFNVLTKPGNMSYYIDKIMVIALDSLQSLCTGQDRS